MKKNGHYEMKYVGNFNYAITDKATEFIDVWLLITLSQSGGGLHANFLTFLPTKSYQ